MDRRHPGMLASVHPRSKGTFPSMGETSAYGGRRGVDPDIRPVLRERRAERLPAEVSEEKAVIVILDSIHDPGNHR